MRQRSLGGPFQPAKIPPAEDKAKVRITTVGKHAFDNFKQMGTFSCKRKHFFRNEHPLSRRREGWCNNCWQNSKSYMQSPVCIARTKSQHHLSDFTSWRSFRLRAIRFPLKLSPHSLNQTTMYNNLRVTRNTGAIWHSKCLKREKTL